MLKQLGEVDYVSAAGARDSAPAIASLHDELFRMSAAMRDVEAVVRRVATSQAPVLIEGETGTGKGLVAAMLHAMSERATGPWVALPCGTLPGERLDAELFGEEIPTPGGDVVAFAGRIDAAARGSLFLDEIADFPLPLQGRLLHVVEHGRFYRNGGRRAESTDTRLIVSTHRNLRAMAASGAFRDDLYQRLRATTVRIPPLRERREEIPLLVEHFRVEFGRELGCDRPALSPRIMGALVAHMWPGNVRELENLVKRYVLLGDERYVRDELDARMRAIPPAPLAARAGESLLSLGRRAAREAERAAILEVLGSVGGNRAEAARRLHVSYKTLLAKLKQIERP